MSHFVFYQQAGSIPGQPGTYSGCYVTILEDGTRTITPLLQQPHLAPEAPEAPEALPSATEPGPSGAPQADEEIAPLDQPQEEEDV